jgi:hypothetical protein
LSIGNSHPEPDVQGLPSRFEEAFGREQRDARIRRTLETVIRDNSDTAGSGTPESSPFITFSDDWHPSSRNLFIRIIGDRQVHLFGLSSERGEVTHGYTVEGTVNQYSPIPIDTIRTDWTGYGVPRSVRMNHVPTSDIEAHANAVLQRLTTE